MTLIDFDARFSQFLRAWLEEHQDECHDLDEVEAMMPTLYEEFAAQPADWLSGLSPRAYFEKMENPRQLLDLMLSYLNGEVPVPDLLLERICDMDLACEDALLYVLYDLNQQMEARMLAIRLLTEIGSIKPLPYYLSLQMDREDQDELADQALDSLEEMGDVAVEAMLDALPQANDLGREALLSTLSRHPGHPEVYEGLIRLFDAYPERQAILAAYLGRLGDERALPLLLERAQEEGISYLDFIELRAAIEALGGEAPEREFLADPQYDALRQMM